MKNIFIPIFYLLSFFSFSQGSLGFEIGYHYKYTNNLKVGLSWRTSSQNIPNPLNVNLGLISNFNHTNLFFLGFQQRFKKDFEAGINITKKDFEPNIGINVANIIKLNVGYNFPFKKEVKNGITLSLSIALSESNKYYDRFKFLM